MLSELYEKALQFAVKSHAGQTRKGTGAPFVSHPLAVSSIVMEFGGSEVQTIAALLHDTIEDCGVSEEEIRTQFGNSVAQIVSECTEPTKAAEPLWKKRKLQYVSQIESATLPTLLVAASDKFHNMVSTLRDLRFMGASAWNKFHRNTDELLWYYSTLITIFHNRKSENDQRFAALVSELDIVFSELQKLK